VAKKLQVSLDEYHHTLRDSACSRMFSIQQYEGSESQPLHLSSQEKDPFSHLQTDGFQQSLTDSIEQLPEREKLLMSLYYNDELNLKEIGQVLEVSESRVCQIHAQALNRIRLKMMDWTSDE